MLTILHTEASDGWGGQEIRIVQEAIGMIRRGYRVIIATSEECKIFNRARESGIDVFTVHFQKKNPVSVLRVLSLIDREKVDIVNTHSSSDSWVATIAARLSKARPSVIRTRHLSTPIGRSFLSSLIYNVLPDAIITTGEEIRQRMINDNAFDAKKIFSIPTGIDLDRFNPSKVRPAFQPKGFSIGMIGVLRSWKGHQFFIKAIPEILESIPDAHFYIVGDGPQYENIKNHIHKLSLQNKVFMLGHRENIPEILSSLDIVVHPSYANEGVPQSILQALAMEKPVIASDTGAIKEIIIDGETGFLIKPKDPERLSEKVIALYKNPELMIKVGKKGRKIIEKDYSIEKMLDKIESLYPNLLDKRQN